MRQDALQGDAPHRVRLQQLLQQVARLSRHLREPDDGQGRACTVLRQTLGRSRGSAEAQLLKTNSGGPRVGKLQSIVKASQRRKRRH